MRTERWKDCRSFQSSRFMNAIEFGNCKIFVQKSYPNKLHSRERKYLKNHIRDW